jgi:localization factor PodJL
LNAKASNSDAISSSFEDTDPWDPNAAVALTDLYESGAGDFAPDSPHPRRAAGSATRADIDPAWLENRFAEIAKGIEQSLAEIHPERGFRAIGDRLDQFEQQFSKMFEGVAKRSDLDAVRLIESHVGEVVNHLVETHDQLTRLNVIEEQLAGITRSLAGMPNGASGAPMPFSDAEHKDPVSELRPLLERMRSESRSGDENTAALLDTMQQAMIRLLDRVDAIEMAQHINSDPFAVTSRREGTQPENDASERPALEVDEVGEVKDFAEPANGFEQQRTDTAFADEDTIEPVSGDSEKLRQDFIAQARRAKMRLSAAVDDEIVITSPSESDGFSMSSSEAARGSEGGRPIRPAAVRSKASGPSGPSPRLVVLAVAALLALSGLWYTLGWESPKPVSGHSSSLAPSPSISGPAASARSEGAKSAPDQDGQANGGRQPKGSAPREEAAPKGDQQGQLTPSDTHAAKTTLPMMGVAVDLNEPVTKASLQKAERHQAMATVSGELGDAAARESNSSIIPASIVPTEAETEGSDASADHHDLPQRMSRNAPLDIPPATVGPLSLRLAAAKGDPSAEFEVGARMAEGKGTPQNFKDAAKWYARSADRGFAQAQYRLGTLYERGLGLKPDRKLAADWYRRAADQGNIKAMHNLAVLSANKTDEAPDYTTAAQWFERAAERGLVDSEFNLAILYENGLGVKRDLRQAFMWLSLAARNNDPAAVRRRDILRGKLAADDIAAAERMIANWRPLPVDRRANDPRLAGEEWKNNPKNGIAG